MYRVLVLLFILLSFNARAESARVLSARGAFYINGIKTSHRIVATDQEIRVSGKGSYCHIQLKDGTKFLLRDGKVKLKSLRNSNIFLQLGYGELFISVANKVKERFFVETPNAKLNVFSTKLYIKTNVETTYLSVLEGVVKFTNKTGSKDLHKFEDVLASADQKILITKTGKRIWSVTRSGFKQIGIEID